ncbi:MAG: HAD-IA family hydrolase [Chthoniobacterales bacterium]|jgi:HAD superfamily hydrolase (TIGR01509 family)
MARWSTASFCATRPWPSKLKELGIVVDAQSLVRQYRGAKLATMLADIGSRCKTKIPDSFVPEYRALTASLFNKCLRPIVGVKAALDLIALSKCVVSSSPPGKISQALRVTGFVGYFSDRTFSSYVVDSWKPDPGLLLYASSQMGFSPSECAVLEDSRLGIQAAASAGMISFLFDPDGITPPLDLPLMTVFREMSALPELHRLDAKT